MQQESYLQSGIATNGSTILEIDTSRLCTRQWMTNNEKNKQVLSTLSVFVRLTKKDRQQQKEERSRDEKDQRNFKKEHVVSK